MTGSKLLASDRALIFVDPDNKKVWIWYGSNITSRMRLISPKSAQDIREKYGPTFKITPVEEGQEPKSFKTMLEKTRSSAISEEIRLCKHCGSRIAKEQKICTVCGTMVI